MSASDKHDDAVLEAGPTTACLKRKTNVSLTVHEVWLATASLPPLARTKDNIVKKLRAKFPTSEEAEVVEVFDCALNKCVIRLRQIYLVPQRFSDIPREFRPPTREGKLPIVREPLLGELVGLVNIIPAEHRTLKVVRTAFKKMFRHSTSDALAAIKRLEHFGFMDLGDFYEHNEEAPLEENSKRQKVGDSSSAGDSTGPPSSHTNANSSPSTSKGTPADK